MYKLLYFTLILLVISCNSKPDKVTNSSPQKEQSEIITPDVSFTSFFERFNTDSTFQLSRIEFPLDYAVLDNEYDLKRKKIQAKEWKFLDLSYEEEMANQETNAYRQEIMTQNDRTFVKFLGIKNGINVTFIFKNVNKQWKLIYWEDSST